MSLPAIEKILQINVVVKNIEKSISCYEAYGVSPWIRDDGTSEVLSSRKVRGKDADYQFKAAFAMIGDIEIELIEPLDEESDYARFLREHGEGVHHIAIADNREAFDEVLRDRKVEELQSGYWQDFGEYRYYDTRSDLGVILEIYDLEQEKEEENVDV